MKGSEPVIGAAVHYISRGANPRRQAAIVVETYPDGTVDLAVFFSGGSAYPRHVHYGQLPNCWTEIPRDT